MGAAATEQVRRTTGPGPARRSVSPFALVAILTGSLLAFFLSLYVIRGYGFPVGSDAPVYLWWTRLAERDGLSAVGMRPGVPTLALVLSGTLRISNVESLASIGAVFATSIGLSAAALIGLETRPRIAFLAGLLAGTYAADLAGGYYANLVFAALFLASAVAICTGIRRGTIAGGVLLAAGGLAHPLFFLLGVGILLLAALPTLRNRSEPLWETDAGRIGAAVALGGALLGAGLLALGGGPAPLSVDTSADGFRRRAGLTVALRDSYYERFLGRWPRYALPASAPLALAGARDARGFVRRFLISWLVVTAAGVGIALATGVVPPARFLGFALALPILGAFGLARVWRLLYPRHGTAAVAAILVIAGIMAAGAAIPWARQRAYLSPRDVARATEAGRVAANAPPGTPLVFVVNGSDPVAVPFLVARAANIIRASVPPDRIRDVVVVLGKLGPFLEGKPTLIGDPVYDAESRLYTSDIHEVTARSDLPALEFVLAPFDRPDFAQARGLGTKVSKGVVVLGANPPLPAAGAAAPVRNSSGGRIALLTLVVLAVLGVAGLGWARTVMGVWTGAVAVAPAFGGAGLIAGAIALERAGVPLDRTGSTIASVLVAGLGYLAWFLSQRRPRAQAPE